MKELLEFIGAHRAKTRGQVGHRKASHQGGHPVIEPVGKAPADTRLVAPAAGANYHVIALVEPVQQLRDQSRIVLAVRIHENEDVAGRGPGAALDCRSVAHGIRGTEHGCAMLAGDLGRFVR